MADDLGSQSEEDEDETPKPRGGWERDLDHKQWVHIADIRGGSLYLDDRFPNRRGVMHRTRSKGGMVNKCLANFYGKKADKHALLFIAARVRGVKEPS